jgi:hypothetical protein
MVRRQEWETGKRQGVECSGSKRRGEYFLCRGSKQAKDAEER